MYLFIKYLLSAAIVVGVTRSGKRRAGPGGLLVSLPLTPCLVILRICSELTVATLSMLAAYGLMMAVLPHFGISF